MEVILPKKVPKTQIKKLNLGDIKKGYWRGIYDQAERVSKTQLELNQSNQLEEVNFQQTEAKVQEISGSWKWN